MDSVQKWRVWSSDKGNLFDYDCNILVKRFDCRLYYDSERANALVWKNKGNIRIGSHDMHAVGV